MTNFIPLWIKKLYINSHHKVSLLSKISHPEGGFYFPNMGFCKY